MRIQLRRHVLFAALAFAAGAALAQNQPAPGPTKPPPTTSPLAKPGTDMVINPTTEQCREGWNPGVKWTRAEFDAHCAQMKASK
jgi:hypothetical protein